MRVCSYLLNKFLTENSIFVHLILQVNRQKTTMKKKITFLKNYVPFLFTFYEKVFAISKISNFYRSVFRCKVLRLFVFYLFEVQSTVTVSSSSQRENVLIQYLFLTREGEKLLRYLYKITKNQKSCVCIKYLTLVRPRKLISVNLAFLYPM